MKEETFNKLFNGFILSGMLVAVLVSSVLKIIEGDGDIFLLVLSAVGAVCGVISTVLSAGGNIWNFLFGLLDVTIYSYALFDSGNYATFALHVLYIIPMEIVGIFQWRKRGAKEGKRVRARRLKGFRNWVKTAVFFIVVYIVTYIISYHFNPQGAITDSLMTAANIVALVLMAMVYMEQWYLWTLVNIASIITWAVAMSQSPDTSYGIVYLIKYSFYFLNGLNGIRMWSKLSRE